MFDPIQMAICSGGTAIAGETTEKVVLTADNKNEGVYIPVNSPVGLKIVDKCEGRMKLVTPKAPPKVDSDLAILSYFGNVTYQNYNGVLSKRALFFGLGQFPTAMPKYYGKYDTVIYLFEETSDTLGMGLTLQKGWYVVDSQTFANEPFDFDAHPFIFVPVGSTIRDDYFYEIMESMSEVTYTVQEENIMLFNNSYFVSYLDTTGLDVYTHGEMVMVAVSFYYGGSPGDWRYSKHFTDSVEITYPVIKQLDPKFIPALDSLILNHPSGKQYKVTVDDNGNLTATEVT